MKNQLKGDGNERYFNFSCFPTFSVLTFGFWKVGLGVGGMERDYKGVVVQI